MEVPNICRTKGAFCHAVMHCSTWLYHLWEPFSLLDFIGSEFCFIWLWNEVFVTWSFMVQISPAVLYAWLMVSDNSLRFLQNIFFFVLLVLRQFCMTVIIVLVWCLYCGDWKISDDVFFMIWLL
jgi:hypothetical protein